MTWPGYQSLYEVARAAGADVTPARAARGRTAGRSIVDRLRRQVTPATRLIVVNAPHNPTGMLPDRATFDGARRDRRRGRRAPASSTRSTAASSTMRPTLPAGADALERGISLGVMSKSFAMAGLRIGWLATHDRDLLARVRGFKDYTTICSSAPSEMLAIIALRARGPRCSPGRARSWPRTSTLLDAFFDDWADAFTWVRPRAGSIGFPRLTVPGRPDRRLGGRARRGRGRPAPARARSSATAATISGSGFGRTDLPEALARLEASAEDPSMTIPARLGIVTLGVADLSRSVAFYAATRTAAPGRSPTTRTPDRRRGRVHIP